MLHPLLFPWPCSGPPTFFILESPLNVTSDCDVKNNAHQIQMSTICHWLKPSPWKVPAYATAPNRRENDEQKAYYRRKISLNILGWLKNEVNFVQSAPVFYSCDFPDQNLLLRKIIPIPLWLTFISVYRIFLLTLLRSAS